VARLTATRHEQKLGSAPKAAIPQRRATSSTASLGPAS
jgi:hypothetical protein